MSDPRLYINRIAEHDWLIALEFGRVDDSQPPGSWEGVGENFGYLRRELDGPIVGFKVKELSNFDAEDPEVSRVWEAPFFHVPLLGLTEASAGEVVLATRALLGDRSTINRAYFDAACCSQDSDTEEALDLWLSCLTAGDSM